MTASRRDPAPAAPRLEPIGLDALGVLAEATADLWRDEGSEPPDPVTLRVGLLRRLETGARAARFRTPSGETLGHALWRRRDDTLLLEQFRIEADRRRAGWGRRCLETLLAEAGPVAVVRVRVLDDNAAALAFWRAAGFTAEGPARILDARSRPRRGDADSSGAAPGA
jgi:GNAT superfamily N-acetyltransferase